jgi:hypothetical protein
VDHALTQHPCAVQEETQALGGKRLILPDEYADLF